MIPIKGIAIWVAECNHLFFTAIRIKLVNLINRLIAYVKESCRIPHGTFSETKSAAGCFELRISIDQVPKLGGYRLQSESALAGLAQAVARRTDCKYRNNKQFISHRKLSLTLSHGARCGLPISDTKLTPPRDGEGRLFWYVQHSSDS